MIIVDGLLALITACSAVYMLCRGVDYIESARKPKEYTDSQEHRENTMYATVFFVFAAGLTAVTVRTILGVGGCL